MPPCSCQLPLGEEISRERASEIGLASLSGPPVSKVWALPGSGRRRGAICSHMAWAGCRTDTYDRHDYAAEKLAALKALHKLLKGRSTAAKKPAKRKAD
jgi:hypothetical protein